MQTAPHTLGFDPSVYFEVVADTLIRNHGPKALEMADYALQKMKAIGDDEGFDLWLGVHEQLTAKAMGIYQLDSDAIH